MCNYSRVDFDFGRAAASAGNRLSFFATRVVSFVVLLVPNKRVFRIPVNYVTEYHYSVIVITVMSNPQPQSSKTNP